MEHCNDDEHNESDELDAFGVCIGVCDCVWVWLNDTDGNDAQLIILEECSELHILFADLDTNEISSQSPVFSLSICLRCISNSSS